MFSLLSSVLRSRFARPLRNAVRPIARLYPGMIRVPTDTGLDCYAHPSTALGAGIIVSGKFDQPVADILRRNLAAGQVMVDIGANIGYMSLVGLSSVGPEGAVYSYEMDVRSYRALAATHRLYGSRYQWIIRNQAVGEQHGFVSVTPTKEYGHAFIDRNSQEIGQVAMIPLDEGEFAANGGRIDLIKIDVEGYELHVLRGARRVLSERRPIVVCELVESHLQRFGASRQEVVSYMESLGYRLTLLEDANDETAIFIR